MKPKTFVIAGVLALAVQPPTAARETVAEADIPSAARDIHTVLLADASSGQTFVCVRCEESFLPASITKVMTVFVAFELIGQGKLSLQDRLSVREETARLWNGRGTSMYLKAGEAVSVDDLLRGIATASANDAAIVLAEGFAGEVSTWTQLMNAQARRIGMKGSRFNTPNGWPDEGKTYVTARDLVALATALIGRHPQLYRRYFGKTRMDWHGRALFSHDPVSGVVDGADGIKTGYTHEAGYNFLGSAMRDGRRLFVVVGGAKTEARRADAARELLEFGFGTWKSRWLFTKGQVVATARVQGGTSPRVRMQTASRVSFANYDPQARVSATAVYDGPIKAPIAKGAVIGRMRIVAGNGAEAEVPLVAADSVDEAGFLDRLMNGLMNLIS